MKRLSLALVAPGNSIHTHRWANALSEHMEVSLFSLENHRAKEGELEESVALYYLPSQGKISYLTAPRELKRICRQMNFDVFNVHYASGYGTLMRLAGIRPAVMNFWGSDIFEFPHRSWIHKWVLGRNIRHADKIVSTSNIMKEEIHKLYGHAIGEISVIPFGVDLDRFQYRQRSLTQNTLKMGTCKILDSVYGIDDMIRSFEEVLPTFVKKGIEAQLHLYGDGPQRQNLEKMVKGKKLEGKVIFHGWIAHKDVPKALDELDLFLLSSHRESFGVSAIEAMASGLPVIATKTEGFSEVIEGGKSGILVDIGNIQEMAEAIISLCDDQTLYSTLSTQGRLRVEKKYNWIDNVGAMIELLSRYR